MKRPLSMVTAAWWGALGERDRLAGRYVHAHRRLRRALAVLRKAHGGEGALAMGLWNSLGIVCKGEGRFSEGARAYRMALRLARRNLSGSNPKFASLYHNLAGLEHARGRCDLAEPLARHGLSIRQRALGDDHIDVGRDLAALAAILDGQSRHGEAETLHRRALGLFERDGRSGRREAAYALANLAACLHLQGRREEAVDAARRAVAWQQRLLGARHPEVKLSEANLAIVDPIRPTEAGGARRVRCVHSPTQPEGASMSRSRSSLQCETPRVPGRRRLAVILAFLFAAIATPRIAAAAFGPQVRAADLIDVGAQPLCLAAGDLNGDGLPDLVVGLDTPGGIAVPRRSIDRPAPCFGTCPSGPARWSPI